MVLFKDLHQLRPFSFEVPRHLRIRNNRTAQEKNGKE